MPVSCYFYSTKASTHVEGFTYHLHSAAATTETCAEFGMQKLQSTSAGYDHIVAHITEIHPNNDIGNLEDYVCYLEDESKLHVHGLSEGPLVAGAGKYHITYHVSDKSNNNAVPQTRTVIVQDTLPPVITLSLKNKLISHHPSVPTHVGISHKMVGGLTEADYPSTRASFQPATGKTQKSVTKTFHEQYNPAEYKVGDSRYTSETGYEGFGNPNLSLMAEAASANGWIIGAVASAVTGVALLGFSARKSAVSVSV